jgi:hypothetical protein
MHRRMIVPSFSSQSGNIATELTHAMIFIEKATS